MCVLGDVEVVDPFAVPETCKPGQFYNRTKGYFKIPDDECVGGRAKMYEPDEVKMITF